MNKQDVENVAKGIQAAIIALYIMTAKDIDRTLIQYDIFGKVMRLITFHINNTFAACNDDEKKAEYKHYFNDDKSMVQPKKKKGKRKTKKKKQLNGDEDQYWNDLQNELKSLYGDFCSTLLLLMNLYNEKEKVREQQISELLKCCFGTFDIQNIDDIQVSSNNIHTFYNSASGCQYVQKL